MIEYFAKHQLDDVNAKLKDKLKDGKTYKMEITDLSIRSIAMSNRFNGHLTYLWKFINKNAQRFIEREEVKQRILLEAASYDIADLFDGMEEWPIISAKGINPITGERQNIKMPSMTTSNKSNKQLMTAYLALQQYAARHECDLPENIW